MAWNITTCSMMTGQGFDTGLLGNFSMAWLGIVLLFFLVAFGRKWVGEEMGVPFSFIGGLVGSIIPYMLIVYFTCSYKFGLIGGLIGGVIGAFFAGNLIGDDSGGLGF